MKLKNDVGDVTEDTVKVFSWCMACSNSSTDKSTSSFF